MPFTATISVTPGEHFAIGPVGLSPTRMFWHGKAGKAGADTLQRSGQSQGVGIIDERLLIAPS